MTPEAAAKDASRDSDSVVLAGHHRLNLRILHRIPYHPEYIAPQEILRLTRLCHEYGVDYTLGLEPAGFPGELVRSCTVSLATNTGTTVTLKRCRVRREILLQEPRGTLIPDGDIAWANQLLGRLQDAVANRLASAQGRL